MITKVDPIKYGLLFERFLSEHRPSPPDVDLDFDAKKRDLVFNYILNKYGQDKCALVSTFSERKAKAALRDTGKVYGIDSETVEYVVSLVPSVYYQDNEDGDSEKLTDLSIEDTLEIVPEFKTYYDMYPDWFNSAIKLSNIPKATSVHAAGTLISPIPLTNRIPMVRSKAEGLNATALNLGDAESAGFIKFDFLSLSTLGVIGKTLDMIGYENTDFISEEYDDPKVWSLIGSKNTVGLFQIGSATYRQRMGRLKPTTIKQLAACLALVRGPCIASKADEQYMQIIEGRQEIELIHPIYDRITHDTNGILIYQEQLMKICFDMGFTLDEGYTIMKLSAKKKIKELKKYEDQFMIFAEEKNMSKEVAERIFKMIVDSGLYSFNESHGIAYAILCYITAYLKTYYPREFMAASLTNAYERKEKVDDLVNECRRLGYGFLTPELNVSSWDFTLEQDNKIRVGLCAIKSFGEKAATEVISKRPFSSMEDFLERITKKECSKRAIVPGIFTGLFSEFFERRIDAYVEFCELTKCNPEDDISVQGVKEKINPNSTDMKFEEVFFGVPLLSDPVNSFKSIGLDKIKTNDVFNIIGLCAKIKKLKDKNGKAMAFITVSSGDGILECIVFNSQYEKFKKLIKKGLICNFNLKKGDKFIVNNIEASAA